MSLLVRMENDFLEGLYRLMVRTLPFHGSNTGSNPVRDILFLLKINNFS